MKPKQIQFAAEELIKGLGVDPQSPNFVGTPTRILEMWKDFMDPEPCAFTDFPLTTESGIVSIKNHESWSFCPHHILPVHYVTKVGYIPEDKKVLGLSKLARMVDCCMPLFPLQEELGHMIAQPIIEQIQPLGVAVIVQGEHLCMRMRGVKSRNAICTTTYMWGIFRDDHRAREEFMLL